jgi:hypothetical protein
MPSLLDRTFRPALGAFLALVLAAQLASAAGADDSAKKLSRQAMEEDYLATNMDAALAKLQKALKTCGKNKCSKDVVTELYGNLGTVYAAGLARPAEAVDAFKKMLEADPQAKPNSAYLTGDVQKAYDEAKAAMAPAAPTAPQAPEVVVLEEKPWAEQATYHSVPVYVEVPEGTEASSVTVRFRVPGAQDWREVKLQKQDGGFGGYIPCTATEKPGKLVYFVTAFDVNLDRVASAGSAAEPRVVEIKTAISGRQPSLPGKVPPSACPRPEQRLSCETNDDCPGTQECVKLTCVDSDTVSHPEQDAEKARKRNWLSLAFSPDLTVVSSASDACSTSAQEDGKLSCFFAGNDQYQGTPVASGTSNTLNGGVGTGTMRVMAGYDRVIGTRMTLGARVGFAFLGHPERDDGKKFLPFHAEARFAFFFNKDPFKEKGVRPYVFANGGVAEANARVSTTIVVDDGSGKTNNYDVDVYQKAGPAFGGAGVGLQYAVSPEAAMVVEVAGRAMFPTFAPVIAPSLGFSYGI